jgi:hypothetical protein
MITDRGFEAFIHDELAAGADVSVSAIHNLFDEKMDISEEPRGATSTAPGWPNSCLAARDWPLSVDHNRPTPYTL